MRCNAPTARLIAEMSRLNREATSVSGATGALPLRQRGTGSGVAAVDATRPPVGETEGHKEYFRALKVLTAESWLKSG